MNIDQHSTLLLNIISYVVWYTVYHFWSILWGSIKLDAKKTSQFPVKKDLNKFLERESSPIYKIPQFNIGQLKSFSSI